MGKSSYSTKVAMGALALVASLYGANSAEAQHVYTRQKVDSQVQQPIKQNKILSGNECLSAAGEGIYLKDFCHDLDLRQDSKVNINQRYNLSALLSGTLTYSAFSAKAGAEMGISRLESFKPYTERDVATKKFLQKLAKVTPANDPASVAALGSAIRDGVLEGSELIGKVAPGRYAIMSTSSNNSLPQFVNIFYDAERARLDSISNAIATREAQRVADSTTNAERVKLQKSYADSLTDERKKYVNDSTENANKIENLRKQLSSKPGQQTGGDLTRNSKKEAYDSFTGKRYGFETGQGSNKETFVGVSAKVLGNPKLSVGFYAQYNLSRGDAVADTVPEVKGRERQLIGPGTYKDRLDEITRISTQENSAEAGLEFLIAPQSMFSIPLRAGLAFGNEKTDVHGKSTITFTRNDQVMQEPSVIENSMPTEKKGVNPFVYGAGLDLNVNKNFSLGASYNQTAGKKGSVRLNVKVKF